jgi:hypothetical protein
MSQLVRLLAVPHQLQGPRFRAYVEDSSYLQLVEGFIKDDVDFVFEEASGHRPSIAEECGNSLLGPGHYSDIDPSRSERLELGIAETLSGLPIDPSIPMICIAVTLLMNIESVKSCGFREYKCSPLRGLS